MSSKQMPTFRSSRPVVGITMGDAAGIGPEVVARALASKKQERRVGPRRGFGGPAYFLVVGDDQVFRSTIEKLSIPLALITIDDIRDAEFDRHPVELLDMKNLSQNEFELGKVSTACGRASVEYIKEAVRLAQGGEIDVIVTAPISKEAVKLAGFDWPGHTELLAHLTGTKDFAMMLVGGPLRVVLVTTHLPIQKVSETLTQDGIYRKIELTDRWLKGYGKFPSPRIGVASLNPHGGEAGIFGDEESEKIAPACSRAREEGIDVAGPVPADVLFNQAYKGRFDAIICMYHDQGLIPLKMIAAEVGVNITLGLPFVRTSPAHGTAFDIVGKGLANPKSMIKAIELAIELTKKDEGQKDPEGV